MKLAIHAAAFCLSITGTGSGAVIAVPGDYPTIPGAVAAAVDGDEVAARSRAEVRGNAGERRWRGQNKIVFVGERGGDYGTLTVGVDHGDLHYARITGRCCYEQLLASVHRDV